MFQLFQRPTCPLLRDSSENICKIVNGETGVNLWNNDWVDEPYKGAFPQYKICTEWVRDSYTPVIDIDEISLFNIY